MGEVGEDGTNWTCTMESLSVMPIMDSWPDSEGRVKRESIVGSSIDVGGVVHRVSVEVEVVYVANLLPAKHPMRRARQRHTAVLPPSRMTT